MKLNAGLQLLLIAAIIFLLDLPWLSIIMGNYMEAVKAIQGGSQVRMRPLAGIIVYPALAYLALKTTSWRDAMFTGLCVYAVYDFTVLSIFEKYPLYLAVADSIWGAALFTAVYFIRERFLVTN